MNQLLIDRLKAARTSGRDEFTVHHTAAGAYTAAPLPVPLLPTDRHRHRTLEDSIAEILDRIQTELCAPLAPNLTGYGWTWSLPDADGDQRRMTYMIVGDNAHLATCPALDAAPGPVLVRPLAEITGRELLTLGILIETALRTLQFLSAHPHEP